MLALVPVNARRVMLKGRSPVLRRLTSCAVLVLPTGWLPKARLVGERVTAGEPILKGGSCGLPQAFTVMLKASAMQAVDRITVLTRRRWTALVSIGVASRARVLPIPGRVFGLDI